MKPGVLSLSILAAVLAAACSAGEDAGIAGDQTVSAAVTAVPPQRHSFATEVPAYGAVVADPRSARELSLPQAGRVVWLDATAGQRVAAGQPLLTLQADPAARLAYAQAQHALAQTRSEFEQTQALYDQSLATAAQLAAARKAYDDARAALIAQRALNGAEPRTQLAAPFAGVVALVAVSAGQRVGPGQALLSLVPGGRLRARVGVEPAAAAAIHAGDRAQLAPVFGGAPLTGRVEEVAAAVDPQTHLIDVWIALPDTADWPIGSALAARIVTASTMAWAVPRDAVLSDARGAYLFQVADGVARRVDVRLVQPAGDPVGVDGALDPARPVVAQGAYELADGMRVRMAQP
jgi:RND family efflux transporter MFP subunit